MALTFEGGIPPLVEVSQHGVILELMPAWNPVTQSPSVNPVEVQRAPDNAGAPGTPVTITSGLFVPAAGLPFIDHLPSSDQVWWYRYRHVTSGGVVGDWSQWVALRSGLITPEVRRQLLSGEAQPPLIGPAHLDVSSVQQLGDMGRYDLIINGDFESGLLGWAQLFGDPISIETGADRYKGAGSLKVPITDNDVIACVADDLADSPRGAQLFLRVQPGERLLIMGAGKLSSASLGGNIQVTIHRFDDDKAAIIATGVLQWATETTWTEKQVVYVVPSDTYYIGIRIMVFFSGGTTGTGWIDELHVFRLAPRQFSLGEKDLGNQGGNFTVDFNDGQQQRFRITASLTVSFANMLPGTTYWLRIVQDAIGSRVPTLSGVIWAGGAAPTWTTTANRSDIIMLYCPGGSTLFAVAFGLNFNATV